MKNCLKISLSIVLGLSILSSFFLPSQKVAAATDHLVINEVRYDVSTASGFSEWVEIYNPTSDLVVLEGYKLTDLENDFVFPANSQIKSEEYQVIAKSLLGFKNEYNLDANYSWLAILADSGDEVILRDKNSQDIDAVVYGEKTYNGIKPHPVVTRPNSIERYPKGWDSDDCAVDFVEQQFPSPFAGILGNINLDVNNVGENFVELFWDKNFEEDFKEFIFYQSTDGKTWSEFIINNQKETNFKVDSLESGVRYYFKIRVLDFRKDFWDSNIISVLTKKVYSSAILVNELLPHPSAGTDNEFIELFNASDFEVDLSGWFIDDEEGGSSPYLIQEKTIISPNSYLIFYKKETKLALNDGGDQARLFWPDMTLTSQSDYYKDADYDLSWSRNVVDGNWSFSTRATPWGANIFTTKQGEIINTPVIPIEEAKTKPKNEWVKVEGIVTAPPGLFGKRVMYIQDLSGGIKIYFDKALWPKLIIGDRVIIFGKISISSGEFQIKVYNPDDIIISGHGPPPKPMEKDIGELNDFIGCLMKISGRVIKISGSTVWIDDGTGEVRLYFYSATGIKKLGLEKGDWIIAVGVLSKTSAGLRILPRSKSDLKIYKKTFESKNKESIVSQVLGVEKAQAAGVDYRNSSQTQAVKTTKRNINFFGIALVLLGFFSLASLQIFVRIYRR